MSLDLTDEVNIGAACLKYFWGIIIGSNDDLLGVQCQAIFWINDGLF